MIYEILDICRSYLTPGVITFDDKQVRTDYEYNDRDAKTSL